MVKKILLDGLYKRNLRVAVLKDNILENFDFESTEKRNIVGNVYVARIIKTENSLQAAFIEYGGNRNGFISLAEIHPEYFAVSKDEKQNLIKEIARKDNDSDDNSVFETEDFEIDSHEDKTRDEDGRFVPIYRRYKISDVIKKDQLLVVQCIKEERGNKGATFTTYTSLAGRYFVLMPNTPKDVGISRRIADGTERSRILEVVNGFNIPKSSGIVARTVSEGKTKDELLADYKYLAGLWNRIREKVISAHSPQLVHQEDSIIKKAIKEYADSTVSEIIVEGTDTFKEAEGFAKMLGYDKDISIIPYKNKVPLFVKHGVEAQIASLLNPNVMLSSGAYLIIHQTEALVSIDVNSGKSNSEGSVEETATKTNLEAANEIARQLRLRNLSGLIVVDFIDMIKIQNKKLVEKVLRDALQIDKARIQIGRIGPFGILELSRQRTQQSFFEMSGVRCEHCEGSGFVKSLEYASMHVLRSVMSIFNVENEKNLTNSGYIIVKSNDKTAIHIMNFKQSYVQFLQERYNVKLVFLGERSFMEDAFKIEFNNPDVHMFLTANDCIDDIDSSEEVPVTKSPRSPKREPKKTGILSKIKKILHLS